MCILNHNCEIKILWKSKAKDYWWPQFTSTNLLEEDFKYKQLCMKPVILFLYNTCSLWRVQISLGGHLWCSVLELKRSTSLTFQPVLLHRVPAAGARSWPFHVYRFDSKFRYQQICYSCSLNSRLPQDLWQGHRLKNSVKTLHSCIPLNNSVPQHVMDIFNIY